MIVNTGIPLESIMDRRSFDFDSPSIADLGSFRMAMVMYERHEIGHDDRAHVPWASDPNRSVSAYFSSTPISALNSANVISR
jgi:hypothetical protein